jgi:hypothetical protein
MTRFRIEKSEHGKFMLIDNDTTQRTIYATRQEAENAKTHLEQLAQRESPPHRPPGDE